jgi:hypothetical protein
MGYKSRTWRDGQDQPRDPMEDTHNALKRMVHKDSTTGSFQNLGNILEKQIEFQVQTLNRFGKLEGSVSLLADRIKLLLWVGGVLFIAAIGVLVKGK